jgi:hypothetical protein
MKIRICILLVVMAVFALPSFAQRYYLPEEIGPDDGGGWSGEVSYSQGQYMDNPCTAVQDWVWVNYSAYVEGAQAEANTDRYLLSEDTTMGGSYSAAGSSLSDVAYSTPFTLRKYHKVNTYDNFHVVTVINFYPASKDTTVGVETACGNGMPDSAQ